MSSTHKHIRSNTANKRPTTAIADGQLAINNNASSPGLFFKDSTGATIIKVGPVHVGATAPNASPAVGGSSGNSTGEVWLDNSLTPVGVKIWDGSAWVNATPAGSTTVQGLLELATNAETQAGSDATRAVTPAGLQSKISDSTSTVSSTTIASSTAVKAAYDLASTALSGAGGTITGSLVVSSTGSLSFEGATDDTFETTIAVADPSADRTITLPDTTGTVITTGDTGTVTSAMIANGTIVDADINASAAIAPSKLGSGALPNGVTVSSTNIANGTIVDADINASAGIALSKLATGSLPSAITVSTNNIVDGTIVNADISASAAIDKSKISGTAITAADTGTVTSSMILDGTIANADISNSAGITDGKLATISTANKVSISALNIDGGTDIGANLADVDLFIVDDGANGSNRKSEVSRIPTYVFGKVSGDITINSTGTASITAGSIVNADISGSAAIADTKLATISTTNKVANSATTGTSSNTVNTLVLRDGSGNFTAGTITASTLNGTTRLEGATSDSAGSPSFTWTGNLNTGMYRPGSNQIGFTCGGAVVTTLSDSFVFHRQAVYISTDGDLGANSFDSTVDSERLYFTGKYWTGSSSTNRQWSLYNDMLSTAPTSAFRISYEGSYKLSVREDGDVTIEGIAQASQFKPVSSSGRGFLGNDGFDSATNPSFTWEGDNNTGMYLSNTSEIGLSCDGSQAARISRYECHLTEQTLSNTTWRRFKATGSVGAENRQGTLGVYKHSGITNPCAAIILDAQDGGQSYFWPDDSGVFRISANPAHIGTTSGTVVGTQTSDERLKNILGQVEYGLDEIKKLNPVRYTLKTDPGTEKIGFIAQETRPIIPESVFDTKEELEGFPEDETKLGMEYVALVPVLVNAIKELSAKNDALEARLAALEGA